MAERDRVVVALEELAAALDWPDERSDLTSAVVPRLRPRSPRRWGVRIAGAVVVTGLVAGPALADRLGVDGVRIRQGTRLPAGIDATLDLGAPVPVADVAIPRPSAIGSPAAAFTGRPAGGVSLVWSPSDLLPEVPGTGVGLLLTAFPGSAQREVIEKRAFEGDVVQRVTVDGSPAWWIAGPGHAFLYVGDDGQVIEDSIRLSGSALVWSREGMTYRLESSLSLEASLRLAESMS